MTASNQNMLWARILVDELIGQGIQSVCLLPGSRSTPLITAFTRRDEVKVFSHLDERSGAFFALGRAKSQERPTPIVSTSGTATVNFHPAVVEAYHAGVPMLVLTADRPPVLRESGANQTIDQTDLYGEAVRWSYTLPEPEPEDRKLRSLRCVVARAVAESTAVPPGPVHLNVPFQKPLHPAERPDEIPDDLKRRPEETGTDDPTVTFHDSAPAPGEETVRDLAGRLASTGRTMMVAGPGPFSEADQKQIASFASAHAIPVAADPVSGMRFGPAAGDAPVLGGYDAYFTLSFLEEVGSPELVLRFGAPPTTKQLSRTLAGSETTQVLIRPDRSWADDTFAADEVITAAPSALLERLEDAGGSFAVDEAWAGRLLRADETSFDVAAENLDAPDFEGAYVMRALSAMPDGSRLFVSNSMPVRDLDRYGRPDETDVHAYANRGASGIDGITSTALGIRSSAEAPITMITGDLAFYHDMNGLLALDRFDLDATIVVINNDGGGIFHMLPIEDYDPPFSEYMKTPHDLDFTGAADMYGADFERVHHPAEFEEVYRDAVGDGGTTIIEVTVDAENNHRRREALKEEVTDRIS